MTGSDRKQTVATFTVLFLVFVCALLLSPNSTSAFTVETFATEGCHEKITSNAIRNAGWPDAQNPPAPTDDDKIVFDNVLFTLPNDLQDTWSLAVLLGVRYNDFGGKRPTHVDKLADYHNSAEGQPPHCLRAPEDDGVDGGEKALAACRAYIMDQVESALGDSDSLDPDTTISVLLSFKFDVATIKVSRFGFHIGHALHSLQDSFTHTFRHPDNAKAVLTVFNYVDPAFKDEYDEAIDGHKHVSCFDSCKAGKNAFRVTNATQASTDLLSALAQPGTRAERLLRAQEVVDSWLSPSSEPCTPENGYCGVKGENGNLLPALVVPCGDCGCSLLGTPTSPAHLWWVLLGGLVLFRFCYARTHRGDA